VSKGLKTGRKISWCPGCGNFGILAATIKALEELNLDPEKVVLVSGIGCHGRITDYIRANSIHGIHGRVLPLATGIKLANHELTVIGFAGDGDAYNIGIGHLPAAARRNIDITYIVHNNMVYGLTTGQASPTSPLGFKTRSTPLGNIEKPLNPILFAIACGATFVARGFAGEVEHLKNLIIEAIRHEGFALIDVLQPCITFNPTISQQLRKRIYKLEENGHNPRDKNQAIKKAQEWENKIPIGIIYKEERPTYHKQIPQLAQKPLTKHKQTPKMNDIIEILA